MTKWLKIICLALCLALFTGTLPAQSIYATLTGTVVDPAQAVVPNAKVSLKNRATGDTRNTVTNSEGYYTFAALPVGAYDLQAEAAGFITTKVEGISFSGGDLRKQDVALKVGSTSERIEVTSVADVLTPVESGEKSATLTTKQLQDFSVVGRSAAEFIKILPGFSISGTGTRNKQNFTGETIGINGNGDGGSQSAFNGAYSVNGLPGGSLDITADGAHVSDPGCNCATPVNPNTDMIQEFKVQTSNFGAENQKGPAVVSSVAKSGGRDFHGGAYMYARDYHLNSNDWLNNAQGLDKNTGEMAAPRPQNRYLFPGGNIGGPVLIPGTNFNKDRNKMFFFTGFEYYLQRLDTGLIRATVPTEGMRNGNFSPAEVAKLGNITASGSSPQQIDQTLYPGGIVPQSQIDPGGKALTNMIPMPNADPNSNGGYNHVSQVTFDQNSLQSMSRVDYTINDNTRLYVRYNLQAETQKFPVGLWWRNGQNQTPYPTSILGKNRSYSTTASLTSAVGPTLTNEFVFGYTKIEFPNVFEDPDKIDRTKLGYPYKGLWKNGVTQMPSITGWGGELATVYNPGGFEVGGSRGLFADKWLPSVSDNVSKVWGTHTAKFGGFFEWIKNSQPNSGNTNGLAVLGTGHTNSSKSQYADLLTGRLANYSEDSFNRLNAITYYQWEAFAQDSWKVSRRLTLEYGMRISHYQPWQDAEGFGYAIFDQSKYNPAAPAADYSGFYWNARDKSVPNAAFPTRALFYAPRVGAAYDMLGTGRTVLRGGWGRYYYHSPQFTSSLNVTAGAKSRGIDDVMLNAVDAIPQTSGALTASAVNRYDDTTPSSDSYSVTISQRIPWSSLLEIAYVGNKSRGVLYGQNLNAVPYGALLKPGVGDPNAAVYDDFRPIKNFQDLTEQIHGLYQNFNSMQLTWLRTKGRYNINANYTYGKSLGITGVYDQFNLANNYGVMPNDRRHIFNVAYSIELGNPIKSGAFLKGIVNGWQISGITQIQSGVNLLGATAYNYNLDATGLKTVDGYDVSAKSINGTNSIPLRPILTCNPGENLGANQYINGSCFKLPTVPGGNGPLASTPVYGPAFMNNDLGMFKNFQISESKKLQLRFNAYNFLNHPLNSFVGGNTTKLTWDATTGKLNPFFGYVTEKEGRRIVQVAVKYYF